MTLLFSDATSFVVSMHRSPAVIFTSHLSILSCSISHSPIALPTAILIDLPYPASIAWVKFVLPGGKKQKRTLFSPKIHFTYAATCALKLSHNNRTHSSTPWSSIFILTNFSTNFFITSVSTQALVFQKKSTSLSHKSYTFSTQDRKSVVENV